MTAKLTPGLKRMLDQWASSSPKITYTPAVVTVQIVDDEILAHPDFRPELEAWAASRD